MKKSTQTAKNNSKKQPEIKTGVRAGADLLSQMNASNSINHGQNSFDKPDLPVMQTTIHNF